MAFTISRGAFASARLSNSRAARSAHSYHVSGFLGGPASSIQVCLSKLVRNSGDSLEGTCEIASPAWAWQLRLERASL